MKRELLRFAFFVIALFLLGFGIAAFMGGDGRTPVAAEKVAKEAQTSIADVAPVTHSPQPAVEGSETVVIDSSDCFAGGQPKSFGTTAGGQAKPTGTTGTTSDASEPAPSGPSGSDSTDSGTDKGADDAPATLPSGHPPVDTGSASECPRSKSDSKHP